MKILFVLSIILIAFFIITLIIYSCWIADSKVKGYILIDNPSGDGEYIVTPLKTPTKKTKRIFI